MTPCHAYINTIGSPVIAEFLHCKTKPDNTVDEFTDSQLYQIVLQKVMPFNIFHKAKSEEKKSRQSEADYEPEILVIYIVQTYIH